MSLLEWCIFGPRTDLIFLFLFLCLLERCPSKRLRLRLFKSDRDEVSQECRSSKCASIDESDFWCDVTLLRWLASLLQTRQMASSLFGPAARSLLHLQFIKWSLISVYSFWSIVHSHVFHWGQRPVDFDTYGLSLFMVSLWTVLATRDSFEYSPRMKCIQMRQREEWNIKNGIAHPT